MLQGHTTESVRLSTLERALSPLPERYNTLCSLVQTLEDKLIDADGSEDSMPLLVALLELKLDFLKFWTALGKPEMAGPWFDAVDSDWERISGLLFDNGRQIHWKESVYSLTTEHCHLQLYKTGADSLEEKFNHAVKLAERMAISSHVDTAPCFDFAISVAKEAYADQPYIRQAQIVSIYQRIQRFLETNDRIDDAAANLAEMIYSTMHSINELRQSLDILNGFLERYPVFDITSNGLPMKKYSLHNLRYQVYRRLGRTDNANFEIAGNIKTHLVSLELNLPVSAMGVFRELQVSDSEADPVTLSLVDEGQIDRRNRAIRDWFRRPQKVSAKDSLQRLTMERKLDPSKFWDLFGANENEIASADELLFRLVGSDSEPLPNSLWVERSKTLREYLLEDSSSDVTCVCLWIALHNLRYMAWEASFRKKHLTPPIKTPPQAQSERITANDDLFAEAQEFLQALEERLALEEARQDLAFEHYIRENRILQSMFPQLLLISFLGSRGRVPLDQGLSFLNRAENISRVQLDRWRVDENYELFVSEALTLTSISGIKIDLGIVHGQKLLHVVDQALEIVDEAESIFSIAISNVGPGHLLFTHELKAAIGQKGLIWSLGSTIIRVLHSAITAMSSTDIETVEPTKDSTDVGVHKREEYLRKLWQWVQRSKARTLAQHMGLDSISPDRMLLDIQKDLINDNHREQMALMNALKNPSLETRSSMEQRLNQLRHDLTAYPALGYLGFIRNCLRLNEMLPDADLTIERVTAAYSGSEPKDALDKEKAWNIAQDVIQLQKTLREIDLLTNILEKASYDEKLDLENKLESIQERRRGNEALIPLLKICDGLNAEEKLLQEVSSASDTDQFGFHLQLRRLRNQMRQLPVLRRYLDIREGNPLTEQDLQKLSASRNGKVVFVDWFRVTESFEDKEMLHMLIVRNNVYRLVDLKANAAGDLGVTGDIKKFFKTFHGKRMWGPDKNLQLCQNLIRPLFEQDIVEPGDLLVFCQTEGLYQFPFHAVDYHVETTESYDGSPIIAHHPVIYCPSLSVLHNCFRSRTNMPNATTRTSLVLGGVVAKSHKFGVESVSKIGNEILCSPQTTFPGPAATRANFLHHISSSELVHVHLHTSYPASAAADQKFTSEPLKQALLFNDPPVEGEKVRLSARELFGLEMVRGAHISLAACSSGRFRAGGDGSQHIVTDEVVGLVPAWMISGAGSVVSATWKVSDEFAALFSQKFFESMKTMCHQREGNSSEGHSAGEAGEGPRRDRSASDADFGNEVRCESNDWIDLAELHQRVILSLREEFGPVSGLYSWGGFTLNGYWMMRPLEVPSEKSSPLS